MLANKLKALKEDLKIWNREVFGDVRCKKRSIMGELMDLDVKELLGGLDPEEHHLWDYLHTWRRVLGGKNLGFFGLRRETTILNSFTKWRIPIIDVIT